MDSKSREVRWRCTVEEWARLCYWSEKKGLSVKDLVREAFDRYVMIENRDYDLPFAEIQRINQLCDLIAALTSEQRALEDIVTHGFDSLLALTKGDTAYLTEGDDDGG